MEQLWWSKWVILVSFLNVAFHFVYTSQIIEIYGNAFSRTENCFRLRWRRDRETYSFVQLDEIPLPNGVILFPVSCGLICLSHNFYFIHLINLTIIVQQNWVHKIAVHSSFFWWRDGIEQSSLLVTWSC